MTSLCRLRLSTTFLLAAAVLGIGQPSVAQVVSTTRSTTTESATARADWAQARRAYEAGDFAESARLLQHMLYEPLEPTRRAEGEQLLAISESRVGAVQVSTDVLGAEILIDGRSVGQSPLRGSWYVSPGEHHIEARATSGYSTAQSFRVQAGSRAAIRLRLQPPTPIERSNDAARQLMGTSLGQQPPSDAVHGAKTFHSIALATTSTLSLAALAVAVSYRVSSVNRESQARQLRAELGTVPEPSGQPCSPGTFFAPACQRLDDLDQESYRLQKQADRALLGFAALGGFSLLYGLYVGLSSDSPPQAAVAPRLAPGFAALAGGFELSVHSSF